MTNSSHPHSESISPRRRRWRRILVWGGVGLGVTTIAVGTAATWFVKERLAPVIGNIVGGIVERPVIVGPVERVTPTSIRFGRSSVPPTEDNPNNATTEAVEVNFSLLSVFFKPAVQLDITLVNADVYLEEDADGQWIRTGLKLEGNPPVDIGFGQVGVRNADISLKPYITNRAPKVIGLDLEQAFVNISDKNQRIRGNLNGEFDQGGTFSIRANAFLTDGDIEGKLRVNQIQLSQFSDLVRVPDFALEGGAVNANLQLQLEDDYKLSKIQGKANLDRVQVDVADLKRPIKPINGDLGFSGTQVEIKELTTGLGDIGVNIEGTVKADPQLDLLQTQLDINTNIEPTQLSSLFDIAENVAEKPIPIPVPISGEIQTDINLGGTIEKPVLLIDVETTQPTKIDKITLDNINTNVEIKTQINKDFSLESNPKIDIKSLQILPAFGGNITGKGEVTLTGLKELIAENTTKAKEAQANNQPEDQAENPAQTSPQLPSQIPPTPPALLPVPTTPAASGLPINPQIKLDFDVNGVGLDSLARSYGLSSPFRWGSVSAKAEISGSLEQPKGEAEFALPAATTPIIGQANLDPNNLKSTIQIAEGNVNITAQRKQQKFNANINASQVALEPLVNAGLLFANLEPNLKSDLANINLSDGRLNLETSLSGSLDNLDPSALRGASDVKINLGNREINAIAQIREGAFSANFESEPLPLTRIRDAGLTVAEIPTNTQTQIQDLDLQNGTVQAEGTVRGNLNNLDQIVGNVSGLVNLGNTGGVVKASGRLTGDLFQADIDTSTLPLNPLIDLGLPFANLSPDVNRQIQTLDLRNGSLEAKALFSGSINNLADVTGTANSQINLGNFGGNIDARGQLTDGQFQASVNSDGIPLEPLVDLGLPLANLPSDLNREIQRINLRSGGLQGQASVSGDLTNLNPTQITANLNGLLDLGQDGGRIKLSGQALRGRWETIINADQIALNRFSDLVESQTRDILQPLEEQGLISQAEAIPLLRGLLESRLRGSGSLVELKPETVRAVGRLELTELPIIKQPLEAAFNWNGEALEIERLETPQFGADGFVAVEFSGTGIPQVSNLNVDVRLSDFDLESPLVQRVLPDLPPTLAAEDSPLLAGIVNFDGNLSGSLSTLQLNGDLSLSNLIVRELEFDPLLAGTVSAGLNQGVNVALAGEQDRIELVLDDQYLPESFLVKQDEAIAQGTTIGGDLAVTLEQFPLSTLSVAPLADQGFGEISGIASADLSISRLETLDPFQMGVQGQVAVDQPALGYLDLDRFQTNLSLNNGEFQLTEGELRRGETQILIAARADLEAIIADLQAGVTPFSNPSLETPPDFEADIDIPNGTLQDVLAILEYYNLSDLSRGLKTPEYGTAADVMPSPVGLPPSANLTQQLQRLQEIQAILQRQLQQEQDEPLPPLEAVRGRFAGDISLEGSIAAGVTAKVDLENQGDWTWGRFKADEFLLEANLDQNNVVRVLPLQLTSDQTVYDFRGAFALNTQQPSGQFRIKNLRLEQLQEELENFVELPNIDVNGQLNFRANIAGSLANPQATGEFTVVEGLFNNEPIKQAKGSFSYNNARLFLGSNILLTEEDPIRIKGTVPYRLPFAEVQADSSILQAQIDIKDEGFNIIDLVNPEVDWVEGKGLVELKVNGNLEQDANGQISRILIQPEGLLKMQDGVLRMDSLQQSIVGLSGTAIFVGDRITINGIEGELVGEAGTGMINIEGVLPIFQPISESDSGLNAIYIGLDNLKVGVEALYTGDAAGLISIGGTVLRPEIGGGITIENGVVLLPMGAASGDAGGGGLPSTGPIKISLDDFRVTLGEGIQIETPPVNEFLTVPIVDFNAEGTLTLNGRLESLDDIRPSGTIELTNGALNLYTTRFSLDRGYPQQAIFLPSEGIIPILDLRLVTRVAETTRFQAPTSAFSSEISEVPSASTLGTVRTIRVTALVRGPASQINDIVQLKSSPSRSKTQLISLLGGSAIAGITGDSTLILANIASAGIFNQIQQSVLNATGLTEFRIYPARISDNGGSTESSTLGLGLEVGLDVTDNISVSLSRVLANEQPTQLGVNYRVNDNLLIRGATGFPSESEIRFEYEVQF